MRNPKTRRSGRTRCSRLTVQLLEDRRLLSLSSLTALIPSSTDAAGPALAAQPPLDATNTAIVQPAEPSNPTASLIQAVEPTIVPTSPPVIPEFVPSSTALPDSASTPMDQPLTPITQPTSLPGDVVPSVSDAVASVAAPVTPVSQAITPPVENIQPVVDVVTNNATIGAAPAPTTAVNTLVAPVSQVSGTVTQAASPAGDSIPLSQVVATATQETSPVAATIDGAVAGVAPPVTPVAAAQPVTEVAAPIATALQAVDDTASGPTDAGGAASNPVDGVTAPAADTAIAVLTPVTQVLVSKPVRDVVPPFIKVVPTTLPETPPVNDPVPLNPGQPVTTPVSTGSSDDSSSPGTPGIPGPTVEPPPVSPGSGTPGGGTTTPTGSPGDSHSPDGSGAESDFPVPPPSTGSGGPSDRKGEPVGQLTTTGTNDSNTFAAAVVDTAAPLVRSVVDQAVVQIVNDVNDFEAVLAALMTNINFPFQPSSSTRTDTEWLDNGASPGDQVGIRADSGHDSGVAHQGKKTRNEEQQESAAVDDERLPVPEEEESLGAATPLGLGPLAGFLPFNRDFFGRAMDRFAQQADELGEELTDSLEGGGLAPWLMATATAAVVYEVARRQMHAFPVGELARVSPRGPLAG